MAIPKTARYGEWESPISTEMLVAESVRLGGVAVDGPDVYWVEGRPMEGGRNVLLRWRAGAAAPEEVTPEPYSVRTRAHEYGGGAYLAAGGEVWFANFADQRLYRQRPGAPPEPLTAPGEFRYADMILDAARGRLICVREDHSGGGEPVNEIVAVGLEDGAVEVLAGGHDFCSTPALSPGGDRLAWLTWDHPNMPWDETMAWVAEFDPAGRLEVPRKVAGGDGVSVFQPAWSPAGELYVAADPGGWWNLNRWDGARLHCVVEMPAEFGQPQWLFGMRTYGFAGDGSIVCAYCRQGEWRAGRLFPETGELRRLGLDLTDIEGLAVTDRHAVFLGGSPRRPLAVIRFDLKTGEQRVLRESVSVAVDASCISEPANIEFPTAGGETAHGFFYPPRNGGFTAPEGELPPLIVISHGGPTAATSTALNLKLQYWTSRGFAVLDVNYRGSTGYGRAYRDRLKGEWGIVDVEDCLHGARYLADAGKVDAARLVIRGGSAGGYTTLAALTFHDLFRAGASYYGVGDLESLVRDTHKFESRYLDQLIGPYPERKDLYRARSPIHFTDRLSCPVIFFQGLDDRVVPPNQAEQMVAALRARRLPVAYLAFEGEQHGFRRAETIRRALEAELYFYGRIFGFTPAGRIEPVPIENLPKPH